MAVLPPLSEPTIEHALKAARGDLFVASQMLGHVSVVRLDRAIRVSDRLRTLFLAIQQVKADPAYDQLTMEQVEMDIERRLTLYRSDALDALHQLATMPIDDNSAQNQVKLAAAARLSGSTVAAGEGSDIENTLRALNDEYHRAAPRIKRVRERIIEFETPAASLPNA